MVSGLKAKFAMSTALVAALVAGGAGALDAGGTLCCGGCVVACDEGLGCVAVVEVDEPHANETVASRVSDADGSQVRSRPGPDTRLTPINTSPGYTTPCCGRAKMGVGGEVGISVMIVDVTA